MAILNTGRLAPLPYYGAENQNRERHYTTGSRHTYVYDCRYRKEDPTKIVKWLRKNFGERGSGWDFILNQGSVIIDIWEPRLVTMYEMWIV